MARGNKPTVEPEYPRPIYNNCGGHMIGPPDYCKFKITTPDNGVWVDLNFCMSRCKDVFGCDRWKEYEPLSTAKKMNDLRMHGVKIHWLSND